MAPRSYGNNSAKPVVPIAISAFRHMRSGIELISGRVSIRITANRDKIIRVRMCLDNSWPEDASWVVVDTARREQIEVKPLELNDAVGFRTPALQVLLERESSRLVVTDSSGRIISEDMPRWPVTFQNDGFSVFKAMSLGEKYFGLGDKTGPLTRNDQAFTFWNTDPSNFQESTDPIYKSVPFALSIREYASIGILLDNTSRSYFDFGKRISQVLSFGAEAKPLDYYIIYGAELRDVLNGYTFLTGPPPMPPLWALGYQQSRYGYKSAEEVRVVAKRLREERFPTDAIYLDIDFQDRFRPFTSDPTTYSDFSGFIAELRHLNFQVVVITDPQLPVLTDEKYRPYALGKSGDHFVHNSDGTDFVGKMWAGTSAYPDFARETTREWWGTLYEQFIDAGIKGFWNDMNEPVVADGPAGTMPLDTRHIIKQPGFADRVADHREIHNIYGMQNSRATYEGLLKLRPNERPFVLTRATFAGGHRYSATWTGDNSATWNHLRLAVAMLLNLGLSGFSFCGADIGGFFGSVSPDMLTRWFQIGAFTPLFRNHAFKDSAHREPWLDGDHHIDIRRRFVEERYRLMPYLYALAEESARTGLPIMRPMFLEFPDFAAIAPWYVREPLSQFMLGANIVIAPAPFYDIPDPYVVTLPQLPWYDYWTGLRIAGSGLGSTKHFNVRVVQSIETIPVYVKGGSILPRQPIVQSTSEIPVGKLELLIYPGPNCQGSIYLDDGKGYDYRNGDFLRQTIEYSIEGNAAHICLAARQGNYIPWWSAISIVLHDVIQRPVEISCSFGEIKIAEYEQNIRRLQLEIPDTRIGGLIAISF